MVPAVIHPFHTYLHIAYNKKVTYPRCPEHANPCR